MVVAAAVGNKIESFETQHDQHDYHTDLLIMLAIYKSAPEALRKISDAASNSAKHASLGAGAATVMDV